MPTQTLPRAWGFLGRPMNLAVVALGYRWATLVIALLIALLAATRPGDERAALLAPLVAAVLVTVMTLSPRVAGGKAAMAAALVLETLVAMLVLWLTGWQGSPLLLYLSAPLVHAAICRHMRLLAILVAAAVGGYVAPAVLAVETSGSDAMRPGVLIEHVALLTLVPLLASFTTAAAERSSASRPSLELSEEDVVMAQELVAGRTYRQIADDQDVSVETVKVAISRLYRRVGARNRAEAVRVIRQLDLPRRS